MLSLAVYNGEHGVHNETIVAEAIAKHGRTAWKVATKFGIDFTYVQDDDTHAVSSWPEAAIPPTPHMHHLQAAQAHRFIGTSHTTPARRLPA